MGLPTSDGAASIWRSLRIVLRVAQTEHSVLLSTPYRRVELSAIPDEKYSSASSFGTYRLIKKRRGKMKWMAW